GPARSRISPLAFKRSEPIEYTLVRCVVGGTVDGPGGIDGGPEAFLTASRLGRGPAQSFLNASGFCTRLRFLARRAQVFRARLGTCGGAQVYRHVSTHAERRVI